MNMTFEVPFLPSLKKNTRIHVFPAYLTDK